jgi:hypothetical protein
MGMIILGVEFAGVSMQKFKGYFWDIFSGQVNVDHDL